MDVSTIVQVKDKLYAECRTLTRSDGTSFETVSLSSSDTRRGNVEFFIVGTTEEALANIETILMTFDKARDAVLLRRHNTGLGEATWSKDGPQP